MFDTSVPKTNIPLGQRYVIAGERYYHLEKWHKLCRNRKNVKLKVKQGWDWLVLNNMKHNIKKTKYIVIGRAQKLRHTPRSSVDFYMNGTKLNKTDEKNLPGVLIDFKLSRNQQIDDNIKKLYG